MIIDYYAVLDIPRVATLSEIKEAYKKQALKWHPDLNSQDTTKKMQLINEAKEILLDPEAKRRYDIEYLKFIEFKNQKEERDNSKTKSTGINDIFTTQHTYSTYVIKDDVLEMLIKKARIKAKEIVAEAIKLSKVGGNAAYDELKTSLKSWFYISVTTVVLLLLLLLLSK
ncbi:MAG: J domain-containing protein [Bacteroidales bacterium]|nr:J domain-containing protein [Bacteroidales bacterium]